MGDEGFDKVEARTVVVTIKVVYAISDLATDGDAAHSIQTALDELQGQGSAEVTAVSPCSNNMDDATNILRRLCVKGWG